MTARPFLKLYQMGLINIAQEEIANEIICQQTCCEEPEDEPKPLNTLKGIQNRGETNDNT